jgi:hypothetical protein
MTPHGILEGMASIEAIVGDRLGEHFDEGVWKTARELLSGLAVDFDFRGATPEASHIEFAKDLIDKDLFRLPFDIVLYRAYALPQTAIVAMQGGADYRLKFVTFGPVRFEHGGQGYAPLLTLGLTNGPCASARINWKSVTTVNRRSRKTGRTWEEEDYHEAGGKVLQFVLGATVLLMSKDVETVTVPAPDRLNKARSRKGRVPIRESRIIKIKTHARASQERAAREFSSPRMHWRRGHFRRVREDLIVPVAPTIVGARDGAIVQPKTYEVSI